MNVFSDNERGLYRKYRVQKYNYLDDGDYTLENPGECFVLQENDPHAIAALRAYAESCVSDFQSLATDLALMAERWQCNRATAYRGAIVAVNGDGGHECQPPDLLPGSGSRGGHWQCPDCEDHWYAIFAPGLEPRWSKP